MTPNLMRGALKSHCIVAGQKITKSFESLTRIFSIDACLMMARWLASARLSSIPKDIGAAACLEKLINPLRFKVSIVSELLRFMSK